MEHMSPAKGTSPSPPAAAGDQLPAVAPRLRALRRRAFARALRVPGPLDTTAVGSYIEAADDKTATEERPPMSTR